MSQGSSPSVQHLLLLQANDIETNPGPSLSQGLSVIHINTRSLRNKVDYLEAEVNQFDIITLSETWLTKDDLNADIKLHQFQDPIRRDRPENPHGGVAIYVKKPSSL